MWEVAREWEIFLRGLSARFFGQCLSPIHPVPRLRAVSQFRTSSVERNARDTKMNTRVTEGAAPERPSFCTSLNKSEEKERLFAVYPVPRVTILLVANIALTCSNRVGYNPRLTANWGYLLVRPGNFAPASDILKQKNQKKGSTGFSSQTIVLLSLQFNYIPLQLQ